MKFLSGTSQGRGQGYADVWVPDVPTTSCPKTLSFSFLKEGAVDSPLFMLRGRTLIPGFGARACHGQELLLQRSSPQGPAKNLIIVALEKV